MGMFDKDKLYGGERMDDHFNTGDEFILWGAQVLPDKIPTSVGDARKTLLQVSRTTDPELVFIVGTLASAIADKANEADPSDFPAVVKLAKVPSSFDNEATVIQFVAEWEGKKPKTLPGFDQYMTQTQADVPSDHPLDVA